MDHAWIDGRPVELEAACAEAARLLERSRLPVIAGLGTDVAGARAAVRLAQRIGAVIDHMHADALVHDLDVVRDAGMMTTTASEARLRADLLLVVGPLPDEALPQLFSARRSASERTVIWLCPGGTVFGGRIRTIGRSVDKLPTLLAAIRATVAGRPVGPAPGGAKTIRVAEADKIGMLIFDGVAGHRYSLLASSDAASCKIT